MDLKPGEVVVGGNGRPLLYKREFMEVGMTEERASALEQKMRAAVNKWVDGAVLRPNSAQKPVWMNDPHFMLFAHLKQFVFSFQDVILKRVWNEAKQGNYAPALALASYVPIMMAADFLKGLLVGGGEQPAFKKNWEFSDYFFNGVRRAGLLGQGDFMVDAAVHGPASTAGPAIEQGVDLFKVAGGKEPVGNFFLDSMPASQFFNTAFKGKSKADPVFME